jgi:RsiW-degrading membrane proteinase PrsW (M82 family)
MLPLMQVAMVLIVQYRLQNAQPGLPVSPKAIEPIAMGGDFTGVPDFALFLQILLGLAFLIIAIFAWHGRPQSIRPIMIASVCGLTLLTLLVSLLPLIRQPSLETGFDSGNSLSLTLSASRLLLSVLIPLYVVWYMSRGPVRAFYRGYYLTEPHENDEVRSRIA